MNKLMSKICAILTIIALTISDFVVLGTGAVSYAIDVAQTNNANVEFATYFMNENGEKIENVEKSLNQEEYLYVDIAVKNEGYFNGAIALNNSNFKIKEEKLSPEIEEIAGNRVTLKQINAGNNVTVKLAVEPIQENKIAISTLNAKTDVVLEGQYVNGKKVARDGYIAIKGTAKVGMNLRASEQTKAELNASLITNSVYEINGASKRVVQILINSKITDNSYPVKNTVIETSVPTNAEEVKVFARSTAATNSDVTFNESNYAVSGNKLTINVANTDTNSASWNKNVQDTFVVTYILPEGATVQNTDITVASTLTTYEDKTLTANQNVHIDKVIDGIVYATASSAESSIYKGKIYSGEARDYTVNAKLNVNYLGIAQSAKITDGTKYISNGAESASNITVYKQTKIDKAEFLRIFGNDGYITIKNDSGTIVKNINKDSNTDEQGKIVTTYTTRTQSIEIVTSEPKALGTLNIENTKTIVNKKVGEEKPIYERNQVKLLTAIKESVTSSYNETTPIVNNSEIALLETTSKADFKVEGTTLSSTEKNNVKMTVVLVNNDESKDLYKDPTIKITLPKEVNSFKVSGELFNGNGLKLPEKSTHEMVNGAYVLTYKLAGTQTEYNTKDVEGTTLIINAEIGTKTVEEDIDTEIKMTYTNDLATEYEDGGVHNVPVKIYGSNLPGEDTDNDETDITKEAKIASSLKAYVGDKELQNGEAVYTGEVVKYELTLENEGSAEAKNVAIEALIPENTTAVKYVKGTDNGYEKDGELFSTFDYYETVETSDRKLSGNIGTIPANQKRTLTYEVKVGNEAANKAISSNVKTVYSDSKETTTNTIENQVSKAELEMTMTMQAREDDSYVYSGRTYGYSLAVKNVSDKKVSDINIETKLNACKIEEVVNTADDKNIEVKDNAFKIKSIEAGETATIKLIVSIDENVSNSAISAVANGAYHSNKVEENVNYMNLSVSMESENEGQVVKENEKIIYNTTVKNNGNADINYIEFSQILSTYLNIEKVTVNGKEVEYVKSDNISEEISLDELEDSEENGIVEIGFGYEGKIEKGQEIKIAVQTSPISEIKHSEDIKIESIANVKMSEKSTKSEKVAHTLKANYVKPTSTPSDDPSEDPGKDPSKDPSKDPEIEKYSISGTAWLDENADGKRDSEEQTLSGIKVTLLNIDEKTTETVETGDKGFYTIKDLSNGKYIAIFEYDTDKYMLTKYKADDVSENRNSDVENLTLNINGESKKVAATDTFEIKGNNISNIDIGLLQAKAFDLELDKSITKVVITNNEGTKTKEYDESKLVKAEVKAKHLKGTTVLVEYKIKVTNKGEVAGYAKNIVDYKPTDLSFNSNLNPEWYQSGDYLYSTSLKDTKIEAGETKELKLILTKTMTESNTGLVNNMAEIKEDYNQLGIADKDSTPGNLDKSEDDLGSANLIISVSTGAAVSYVLLTISIVATIAAAAYLVSKKISKENTKF